MGLLFTRPQSSLAAEIEENLDYFHHRSGRLIDFFCIGYAEDPKGPEPREATRNWSFSNEAFVSLVKQLGSDS